MTKTIPEIICCGEALIDMLPTVDHEENPCCRPVSGGAVFNTAIALGRLGSPTGFLAGLSTDIFGEQLAETLQSSNVDSALCPRLDAPTTLAFVKLIDGQASYAFYDENTAGRMFSEAQLPDIDDSVAAMHFGAISLVSEPCGTTYETLLLKESANRVISLDPNIRPGFITDADRHRERINRLIDHCDILKVSDEDLEWLEPDTAHGDAADAWIAKTLDRGVKLIALTRGGGRTRLSSRSVSIELAAEPRTVEDTVGAGDTFNAGLLSALHEMDALSKSALGLLTESQVTAALTRAMHVAGVVVERVGANPPWRDELPETCRLPDGSST